MKKYTPILFACFCLGACHTSSTNVKPTIDRTLNMVQERQWSGYYHDTTYYSPGSGHTRIITDTILKLIKTSDTTLTIEGSNATLTYKRTDSAVGKIVFQAPYHNLNDVMVVYYYNADSLVYSWGASHPTEMPFIQSTMLFSHK